MPARHGVRQRTVRPKKQLRKQMNDSKLIASATNDALFELDFISGENWHNKVSYDNLNSVIIYQGKINHYGDLSCILTIEIELLKVLK
jgi:hypothetical protein